MRSRSGGRLLRFYFSSVPVQKAWFRTSVLFSVWQQHYKGTGNLLQIRVAWIFIRISLRMPRKQTPADLFIHLIPQLSKSSPPPPQVGLYVFKLQRCTDLSYYYAQIHPVIGSELNTTFWN